MLRVALLVALLGATSGLNSARFSARPWQRRGFYTGRSDMPLVADVGAPAPWQAPRWVWSYAWRLHERMLPLLHRWDRAAPADTCVNLIVVWLKAIAGNRGLEGTSDGGAAFAMLPHFTRLVVASPLAYLYPRLHHANIAVRTAYLDREVERELRAAGGEPTSVVVLGAGFDTRALRFGAAYRETRWYQHHNYTSAI